MGSLIIRTSLIFIFMVAPQYANAAYVDSVTINGTVPATKSGTWDIDSIVNPIAISGTVNVSSDNSLLATKSNQTNGAQKTQIVNGSNIPVVTRALGSNLVSGDNALVTNTVIHGLSSGGGGGYVDVKVNPSGSLVADVSGSSVSIIGSVPTHAVTQSGAWGVTLNAGANSIGSISNTGFDVNNFPAIQGISGDVTLRAGSATIGSIGNTSFGISGTLPAFAATPTFNLGTIGSAATETTVSNINAKIPSLGQAVASASTPVVLPAAQITSLTPPTSVGRTWTLASSTDSTSSVITSMPAISGTVTANIGTTNGVALDSSVNSLLKPSSTLSAVTTVGSITNTVTVAGNVGISGTPTVNLGTGSFIDRTTAASPYANRLSDGSSFYDARSIRALTSTDVVTVANPQTSVSITGTPTVSVSSIPLATDAATETTSSAINAKLPSGLTVTSGRLQVELPAGGGGLTNSELRATPVIVQQSGDLTIGIDSTELPSRDAMALPIRTVPQKMFRTTFAKTIASGVDSEFFTVIKTGTGQTIAQSNGNLVLTSGTTTNSDTILRSVKSFTGSTILKYQLTLSQRIANNNFYVELVDVVGDNLAYTINSATSVTVTIPTNPFTSGNVGQSMFIGNITGAAGIPARYTIASVAGSTVTFTVSAWPATGTGTLSLFGWNYHQVVYNGVTATATNYDSQRRGWNNGYTAATINTTASGHMGILLQEDGLAAYLDQLTTSSTGIQTTLRANRVINLPEENTPLYLQIRSVNGTVAPATTTTATFGMLSVENYASQPVTMQSVKAQGISSPQPVQVSNTVPVTVSSGTVTTVSAVTAANINIPTIIADVASAALTTTTTTATLTPTFGTSYQVNIPVTVVSGTTPTLDVVIQQSDDTGTNWYDVFHFPRITTTGIYRSPVLVMTGNRIRYVQTVAGTTPSFTRAINRLQSSTIPESSITQLIDRTISLTTLNAATAALRVQNARSVHLELSLGAATTPPAIQLEGSSDGSNWYSLGTPLTGVASSTVMASVVDVNVNFLRARVSTAGATVTSNYLLIKGY